jgi:hypothetical protein
MTDDKSKVGDLERSRAASDQDYEVRYLIEWYGISEAQARELVARIGNDRQKLDEAAEKLAA